MKTSDGTSKNSKFRVSRYEKEKGKRSEANAIEGKGKMGAVMDGMESQGEPKQAAPTGPAEGMAPRKAREIHITHDDASGMHHVTTIHDDGTEEHSDHPSRQEAHFHGAQAAGAADEAVASGEPEVANDHDEDDYQTEALD